MPMPRGPEDPAVAEALGRLGQQAPGGMPSGAPPGGGGPMVQCPNCGHEFSPEGGPPPMVGGPPGGMPGGGPPPGGMPR